MRRIVLTEDQLHAIIHDVYVGYWHLDESSMQNRLVELARIYTVDIELSSDSELNQTEIDRN